MTDCTYCGSDIYEHDPVFVSEREEENENKRVEAGQFCNYACLSAHIEEEGLMDGVSCNINTS
ncbi:MAG: hypothetical protein SXQ77_06105 [Halobacteria archaeon]|nr:hypothetical protein [Halobacteria archaeon]